MVFGPYSGHHTIVNNFHLIDIFIKNFHKNFIFYQRNLLCVEKKFKTKTILLKAFDRCKVSVDLAVSSTCLNYNDRNKSTSQKRSYL